MTAQPIYTPSHESLLNCEPDALLAAFIVRFNHLTESYDNLHTALKLSEQGRDGWKRAAGEKDDKINELNELIELTTKENERCRQLALDAEKIAHASMAMQRERDSLKQQVKQLQQELTALKGSDNPTKLRAQVQRIKDKNSEYQKHLDAAKRDNKDLRNELKQERAKTNSAIDKIRLLQKELSHNTGAGIFHKGKDHLIIWPQVLTMAREDGSTFEGRGLLYLHHSGRGGLMTFDPDSGTHLCAAPKGGMKPASDTLDFAHNWLYKVNNLQNGIVKDDDLKPIDYNKA